MLTIPLVSTTSGARSTIVLPDPMVTAAQSVSLFGSAFPALMNQDDGVSYELGMLFQSSVPGTVTKIRVYRGSSEAAGHVGKLYSASGTLLASVNFSGETASGWQEMPLATPMPIAANTTYVVSVTTPNRLYVCTVNGLATKKTNGPLSSVVGGNGVFGPVGSMPRQTWNASNYFRDVVFVPGPPPPPDTQAPSVPGNLRVSPL